MIEVTPTISIEEHEIEERFVRASGPGGQNVNKVATAVELRFDVKASSLPLSMKHRLETLAGSRLSSEGVLLIDSREHRTQKQNREEARARLLLLLRAAAVRPKRRRATKPPPASRDARIRAKKKRGEVKALRTSKGEE